MGLLSHCLGAAAALAVSACASLPPADWGAKPGESLPNRVEMEDVPFYPQEAYQCGPAALATALGGAGIRRSPEEMREEVYLPVRQGSLQPEMLAASRRSGAVAYRLAAEPRALLRELAAGHPVVVLQNLRYDWAPQWHYAVAVGYDLAAGKVILRSGKEKRLVMDLATFDRSWAKSQRWAFVALTTEQLPATANEADYVNAAVALERVLPAAAEDAYRTALKTWPHSLLARIGIGNAAYRRGDLAAAEAAFRQAASDHPESGDAWNNLAQVLYERGNAPAARQAAERSMSIGGPRLPTYRKTYETVSGE